jgi:hypothetical protein
MHGGGAVSDALSGNKNAQKLYTRDTIVERRPNAGPGAAVAPAPQGDRVRRAEARSAFLFVALTWVRFVKTLSHPLPPARQPPLMRPIDLSERFIAHLPIPADLRIVTMLGGIAVAAKCLIEQRSGAWITAMTIFMEMLICMAHGSAVIPYSH